MRIVSQVILFIFIFTTLSSPAYGLGRISVAISPSKSGGAQSAEAASALKQALSLTSTHHIIDRQITDQVIDYYDKKGGARSSGLASAKNHLARAQEHYFRMHFEDALAESTKALELIDKDAAPMEEKGQLMFDTLMSRGLIGRALKDNNLTESSFRRAAQLNPIYAPDPKAYPPSVIKEYDGYRSQLKNAGAGQVFVRTDPEVVDVYINGIRAGVTPLELKELPVGSYQIALKANKYRTIAKSISIEPGRKTNLSEKLVWADNESTKNGTPSGIAGMAEIDEAQNVAELLKADRAALISAQENNCSGFVRARIVDRKYRAAMRPMIARYDAGNRAEAYAQLADEMSKALDVDLASDPSKYADPEGTADPMLMGKNKKKIYRQPIFWGAIGVAAAGAIAGGVLAATGGGSGGDGSVHVKFR